MKILHKYRRLIGVILTFTVSVMLLVSTIPASAATVNIPYCSYFPYGQIETFGEGSRAIYSSSKAKHFTSSGGSGSIVAFNSDYSSLGRCYRDENYNSDFIFAFTGTSNIVSYIDSGTLGIVLVFRGMQGEIISWFYNSPYGYQPISSDTLLFTYNVRYYFQSQILDYFGFGQADLVGVGLGTQGAIDCTFTFKSLEHSPKTDSNEYTDIEDSGDSSSSSVISTLLKKLFSFNQTKLGLSFGILGSLITTSIDSLTDSIVSKLDFLGNLLSVVWSGAKPVLKPLYEEVLLPSLDSILNSVNVISTKTVEKLSPVLADMINFFSPYFNRIMDIITNNFLNLVTNLTPLVNQFVTAISPSLDGIVTNISKNISKIFNECFVPSDTSTEYQEFVGMKNDISNKFPVFNQLKSFVTVLFNSELYNVSPDNYSYILVKDCGSFSSNSPTSFRQSYSFEKNKYYFLTFSIDVNSGSTARISFYNQSGGPIVYQYTAKSGVNEVILYFTDDVNVFWLGYFGQGSFSYSNVLLYSLESKHLVPNDFKVNIYGKEVSVLNFDWYMPYKHYGDICVIAFCYLAFIWHTFKRIPNII